MRRVLGVLAVVLAAAACSSPDPFDALPDPKPVDIDETTTTTDPDTSGVALPPALGSTTTSVGFGPGPLTIVGRVEGPDGPVGGAIVQLERFVGEEVATTRVPTAADGTWNLTGVLGGRYRLRAWRAPDLAMTRPAIVFLESGPNRAIDLRTERVGGLRVDSVVAPDPPIVDEPANLKVRVAQREVDGEGSVRDTPVPDARVTLAGTGDWLLMSPNPSFTDRDGEVVFRVTCRSEGEQPLFATIGSEGESYALALPACVDPSTTTTSTTATTGSTSSSTSTTSTTSP